MSALRVVAALSGPPGSQQHPDIVPDPQSNTVKLEAKKSTVQLTRVFGNEASDFDVASYVNDAAIVDTFDGYSSTIISLGDAEALLFGRSRGQGIVFDALRRVHKRVERYSGWQLAVGCYGILNDRMVDFLHPEYALKAASSIQLQASHPDAGSATLVLPSDAMDSMDVLNVALSRRRTLLARLHGSPIHTVISFAVYDPLLRRGSFLSFINLGGLVEHLNNSPTLKAQVALDMREVTALLQHIGRSQAVAAPLTTGASSFVAQLLGSELENSYASVIASLPTTTARERKAAEAVLELVGPLCTAKRARRVQQQRADTFEAFTGRPVIQPGHLEGHSGDTILDASVVSRPAVAAPEPPRRSEGSTEAQQPMFGRGTDHLPSRIEVVNDDSPRATSPIPSPPADETPSESQPQRVAVDARSGTYPEPRVYTTPPFARVRSRVQPTSGDTADSADQHQNEQQHNGASNRQFAALFDLSEQERRATADERARSTVHANEGVDSGSMRQSVRFAANSPEKYVYSPENGHRAKVASASLRPLHSRDVSGDNSGERSQVVAPVHMQSANSAHRSASRVGGCTSALQNAQAVGSRVASLLARHRAKYGSGDDASARGSQYSSTLRPPPATATTTTTTTTTTTANVADTHAPLTHETLVEEEDLSGLTPDQVRIRMLLREIGDLKGNFREAVRAKHVAEEQMYTLEAKYLASEKEVSYLRMQKDSLTREVSSLTEALGSTSSDLSHGQRNIRQLEVSVRETKDRMSHTQLRNDDLEAQLAAVRKENQRLHNEVVNLMRTKNETEVHASKAQEDCNDASDLLVATNAELKAKKETVHSLRSANISLQHKVDRLEQTINALKNELELAAVSHDNLSKSLLDEREETRKLKARVHGTSKTNSSLADELDAARTERDALKAAVGRADDAAGQLQEQVDALRAEVATKQKALAVQKKQKDFLLNKQKQLIEIVSNLHKVVVLSEKHTQKCQARGFLSIKSRQLHEEAQKVFEALMKHVVDASAKFSNRKEVLQQLKQIQVSA